MKRIRLVLAVAGIALMLFGAFRLVTQIPFSDLVVLAFWLAGAVIIHDGIVSPIVVGIGVLVSRHVPPRGRRYLQWALIAGALVTVVALPMIYRKDSQPRVKAILLRNYAGNLTILLAAIAAVTLFAYAIKVARGSTSPSSSPTPADVPSDVPDRDART